MEERKTGREEWKKERNVREREGDEETEGQRDRGMEGGRAGQKEERKEALKKRSSK